MDAERLVVDHLNASGIGAAAYYDVPSERPESFVVVERTGGARGELVVDVPRLDVQCWASTRRAAALLADGATRALLALPDVADGCFGASITSRYRDADIDSGTPRYHVVCELTLAE